VVQIVRLIDHQNDHPAALDRGGQNLFESFMQLKVLSRNFAIIELAQQGLQQVVGIALRIENECRTGRLAIPLEDLKQQRGLPHARFRDQRAESQVALYAVNE